MGALAAAAGCAGRAAVPAPAGAVRALPPDPIVLPRGPAAVSYGGQRASTAGPAPDPLRSAIVDDARRIAGEAGQRPPIPDRRLDAAMEDLARAVRGDDLPSAEVVDFLIGHYGLVEPAPHLIITGASPGADVRVRELVAAQLPAALRSGPVARVGVGIDRSGDLLSVVVGLQECGVAIDPIARQLPSGGTAAVTGTLLGAYQEPHVIVTSPGGQVRELAAGGRGERLRAVFRCDHGVGRYQVEVTGSDRFGSAVLANFPVFCGVTPPDRIARAMMAKQVSLDPGRAERAMLELVNRDRESAGASPVAWDEALAAVARAHSREMAADDYVGHVSPRTGDAMERVRHAGMRPTLVLENVGRAYSIEEAQRGFMGSPGHRGNVIDARVKRLGVGVVLGAPAFGQTPFIVTQLYRD